MIPAWLHNLSIAYLLLGALCAAVITVDVARHPQRMLIMNLVWPITAVFGTVWIVAQYFAYGRPVAHHAVAHRGRGTPFAVMVANGSLHCGSGCTLGDIVSEWLVFAVPAIAIAFG